MKRFSIFFFGFWLVLGCSFNMVKGQACYGGSCYGGGGAPVNELGIRLGGLTNSSINSGRFLPESALHVGILNGLHYKRYQSIGAVRLAASYEHIDVEEIGGTTGLIRTDGTADQWKFKAGYEFFTFLGPLEPYAGIDALVALGKYEGETYTYGNNDADFWQYNEVRRKRGFGFAPVLGLRCYVGSFVSIGAETTLEAMLYNRETVVSNLNPERVNILTQRNYYETTFHPVSWLSLNVLF